MRRVELAEIEEEIEERLEKDAGRVPRQQCGCLQTQGQRIQKNVQDQHLQYTPQSRSSPLPFRVHHSYPSAILVVDISYPVTLSILRSLYRFK